VKEDPSRRGFAGTSGVYGLPNQKGVFVGEVEE